MLLLFVLTLCIFTLGDLVKEDSQLKQNKGTNLLNMFSIIFNTISM